tara:strand:- start:127 stop:318 length:192 start_codon:yes stop_codon:yes gene_type:complete
MKHNITKMLQKAAPKNESEEFGVPKWKTMKVKKAKIAPLFKMFLSKFIISLFDHGAVSKRHGR